MIRECKQCKIEKNLTALNFLQSDRGHKIYYTHICRKCYNHNEILLRKKRRNTIKPSKGMHYIRHAVIGHKTEPYFEGENFEYIAPSYNEILKEYEIN